MPNRYGSKYPLATLALGEAFLFPVEHITIKQVQQAAANYGRRNGGEKFTVTERVPGWAECRRIS